MKSIRGDRKQAEASTLCFQVVRTWDVIDMVAKLRLKIILINLDDFKFDIDILGAICHCDLNQAIRCEYSAAKASFLFLVAPR